jgi:hypothetical protein
MPYNVAMMVPFCFSGKGPSDKGNKNANEREGVIIFVVDFFSEKP